MAINKILIIAVSRSGSRNIMKAFHKYFNFRYRAEPWNYGIPYPGRNRSYEIDEKQLVLKTLADQKPEGMEQEEFYNELIPKFDLVILLSRKNKQEVCESYQHFLSKDNWHTKWTEDKSLKISEEVQSSVDRQYHYIDVVNDEHNIPITWYEDLYSGNFELFQNITKDWGVDSKEFFKYFNPKDRLRQN